MDDTEKAYLRVMKLAMRNRMDAIAEFYYRALRDYQLEKA